MSKKRPRAASPLTKDDPAYWRERLFQNAFTYKGRRRKVRAWSVKIQLFGKRKTFTLSASESALAAGEACQIYRTIAEQGWEALTPPGQLAEGESQNLPLLSPRSIGYDAGYWRQRLLQRKNQQPFPGQPARELCVRIEHARVSHYFPLGTNDETEAAQQTVRIFQTVVEQGWTAASARFCRELAVALRWRDNPLEWTYFNLCTVPAGSPSPPLPPPHQTQSSLRVLVIEPDAGIRRSLQAYANCQSGFRCEAAGASAAWAAREISRTPVDLILANHVLPEEVEAARLEEIQTTQPGLPLVTYSVFADADRLFMSTPGGSSFYLLKRTSPGRLFEPLAGLSGRLTRERLAALVTSYFQNCLAQLPAPTPAWKLARLTPREQEILDYLSKGDLLKEIAGKLGISQWTVQGHVKNIFEKLKVHTRTEAVVKYLQK